MKFILTGSRDAVGVDFTEEITADTEPNFWDCYDIAQAHNCAYFSLSAEKLT